MTEKTTAMLGELQVQVARLSGQIDELMMHISLGEEADAHSAAHGVATLDLVSERLGLILEAVGKWDVTFRVWHDLAEKLEHLPQIVWIRCRECNEQFGSRLGTPSRVVLRKGRGVAILYRLLDYECGRCRDKVLSAEFERLSAAEKSESPQTGVGVELHSAAEKSESPQTGVGINLNEDDIPF